jgi:predicted deacylase
MTTWKFKVIALLLALALSPAAAASARAESLAPYPSPEAMLAEIYQLEKDYPGQAQVIEYGRSVENRPLLAVRISKNDGQARPAAMVAGNIHGVEYIGNRLAMAVARRLLADQATDPWIASLLERMDFYVLPCLNPDGYARTWAEQGRGAVKNLRRNHDGVDLNRNFPRPGKTLAPINWAGSGNPNSAMYRGPEPLSEPETRAVRDFVQGKPIFASIDFHSVQGTLIPAKCPSRQCVREYKQMAKAFRSAQPEVKYWRFQLRWLDTFTGEMEDMLYYESGIRGVCVEIGKARLNRPQERQTGKIFWLYNPENPDRWIQNDRDAALKALEAAYSLDQGRPAAINH